LEGIEELISIILEDLPPIGVGASDVHDLTLSIALNVPRLVVHSGSDGIGWLMEVPSLRFSSVSSLDTKVVACDEIE
jgi:hypothetical protein